METILNELYKDIPQQFHDKEKIEILLRSYCRQLAELKQVFDDLDNKTTLDNAEGVNLDNVGGIVNLTRKEAGLLAGVGVEDPVISDERYRQFLKYKVLANTNECTYSDLMNGLAILWDISPVYYLEDEALPAVIILTMPFLTPGGKVVTLGEVPMIKPSGVRIEFMYYIRVAVEVAFNLLISTYEVPRCNTIVCGTYPKRATVGKIVAIESELDANAIMQAFESNPSGAIRIGGKAFDAMLGVTLTEDIEIEINSNLQIVDVIRSGQSVAGTNPDKTMKGIVITNEILADSSTELSKYSVPTAGTQTSGGGELAESISVSVEEGVEIGSSILIGTPTETAASQTAICGSGTTKLLSVQEKSSEAEVTVYIGTATVRKCGTATCGNTE